MPLGVLRGLVTFWLLDERNKIAISRIKRDNKPMAFSSQQCCTQNSELRPLQAGAAHTEDLPTLGLFKRETKTDNERPNA
jgi:hypothetical protein